MTAPTAQPAKKLPLAQLALAAGLALVIAAAVVWAVGWETVWSEGKRVVLAGSAVITGAGPAVYFGAMALLPAVGVPMAPFALAAGPLFGAQLGFAALILFSILAITVNLTLTYWLARRWLRPFLAQLLARFGYALPVVKGGDITDLIVLLRATPGIPFFAQNYLLGLANAPFGRYLAISCAIQWTINVAFLLFGEALSQGRGKTVLTAVLLLVAITVATNLARKHLMRKKAAAQLS
jgi:uncharacterized membrane protein YdjX (TVP38/TMEM64 family)